MNMSNQDTSSKLQRLSCTSPIKNHLLRTSPIRTSVILGNSRDQFIIKNSRKFNEKVSIDKENQRLFRKLMSIMNTNQYIPTISGKQSPRPKSSSFFQRNRQMAQIDQDNSRIANKLCTTKPQIGTLSSWKQDYSETKKIRYRLRSYEKVGKNKMKMFRNSRGQINPISNYEDAIINTYLDNPDSLEDDRDKIAQQQSNMWIRRSMD